MKYIIEIEDEPLWRQSALYGEDAVFKAKNFNALVFDKNGLDKLTPLDKALDEAYQKGFEVGSHEATTLEFQCGLDYAWEAARKIARMWEEDMDTEHRVVIDDSIRITFDSMTASEAIAKIREYEQQKVDSEIKVGDWVFNKHVGRTSSAKVTCVDGQKVYMLCGDGSCGFADITDLEKTNVPNPKIEQLLEMLKSEQRNCHTCKHKVISSIECVDCRGFGKWEPKEGVE